MVCSAYGSYCLKDDTAPYCPSGSESLIGDPRCCVAGQEFAPAEITSDTSRSPNSIETMVDAMKLREKN